jgi:hypothetical protein
LTIEAPNVSSLPPAVFANPTTAAKIVSLRPRQGQRPVFLSYEPLNAPGQIAAKDSQINPGHPDPDPSNPINELVAVRVPATAFTYVTNPSVSKHPLPALTGIYDGQPWTIMTGETILLDVGANQQQVQVVVPPQAQAFGGKHEGVNQGGKIFLNMSTAQPANMKQLLATLPAPIRAALPPTPTAKQLAGMLEHLPPGLASKLPPGTLSALNGKITHARGCIMQLNYEYSEVDPVTGMSLNYVNQLGNPGPQPGFNYKDQRYIPVVPVVVQIK